MSREELERFSNDLRQNQTMQEELRGLGTDAEAFIRFAKEQGYDFTLEELEINLKAKAEHQLTDEELETVAGGKDGGSNSKDGGGKGSLINAILGVEVIGDVLI